MTEEKLSVLEKHGFAGISRWPSKSSISADGGAERYILGNFAPSEPFITKGNRITAFGSCFAGNVSRYLAKRGYTVNAHQWKHANSDFIRIDEIMVHTPALLKQFEWAFENRQLGEIIIDGKQEDAKSYHDEDSVKSIIRDSDVFIVTFGLTEAWYDKENDDYLWKFVPNRRLNSERFENRIISYAENLENIRRIYSIIRRNRADATIIFTLSPIPLLGTYSGRPVIPASTFSKAILRAAIGEFHLEMESDERFFYFPSYEMIMNARENPWQDDNRHLEEAATDKIMTVFSKSFLVQD